MCQERRINANLSFSVSIRFCLFPSRIFDLRYTNSMIHLRNVIAVLALIVVIYLVTNYSGMLQQKIGVKGASTVRGQQVAGKVVNDIGTQVDAAKDQAMHVSLSDVMNYFSRFQRVPQDITSIKNYAQEQVNSVLESKDRETTKNKTQNKAD